MVDCNGGLERPQSGGRTDSSGKPAQSASKTLQCSGAAVLQSGGRSADSAVQSSLQSPRSWVRVLSIYLRFTPSIAILTSRPAGQSDRILMGAGIDNGVIS